MSSNTSTTAVSASPTPGTLAPPRIVGGIGGLVFVAVVVLQNALRASAPKMDAATSAVVDYYADHHGLSFVLAATFVISGFGFATFAGALLDRLRAPQARGAALAGGVGLVGIFCLFSVTIAANLALAAYVHRGNPSTDVVDALWMLHNAVFIVLALAIGIALAGLSASASDQGLVAPVWRVVGLVGGLASFVEVAFAPAILDGSKVIAVGLVGFLTWLVFVATTSINLLRNR
ncbi:MAG: hypothetical protein HY826_13345 [Actinobacteria bacterium]|nr:hypothetical protein [Actinomycetota bacterium]